MIDRTSSIVCGNYKNNLLLLCSLNSNMFVIIVVIENDIIAFIDSKSIAMMY